MPMTALRQANNPQARPDRRPHAAALTTMRGWRPEVFKRFSYED